MHESILKAILVDHLIKTNPKSCILGTEVPYASGQRRVDILSMNRKVLHAYEIKSEHDNLSRLSGQMVASLSTFDYTSLVFPKSIAEIIRQRVHKSIGLIEIDTNTRKTKTLRKATLRKRLNKQYLSAFLWKTDLISGLLMHGVPVCRKKDTTSIRNQLIEYLCAAELHNFSVTRLRERYKNRYCLFMRERGKITHPDDLRTLSIGAKDIEPLLF